MMLHNDKETFIDLVKSTADNSGIAPAMIEKDYYVTLILNTLNQQVPGLLFKGGTSLAKCYDVIERFSEDVDLTLDKEHYTQGQKRDANKAVIEVCDKLGLNIANREEVEMHSHGNFNQYSIEYPIAFPSNDITPYVKVEMVFLQRAYPDEKQKANSYIGSYLESTGNQAVAKQYDLTQFDISTQTLERTFVDKVFAVCDYYCHDMTHRNSRHIYDLSCLLTRVDLNSDKMVSLIDDVREDRKHNKLCISAQDGVDVPSLLKEIIDTDFYKKDYEESTSKLLMKPVPYEESIKSLQTIIDSRLFEREYYNKLDSSNDRSYGDDGYER